MKRHSPIAGFTPSEISPFKFFKKPVFLFRKSNIRDKTGSVGFQTGFTMFELLIVMSFMAIIGTVGIGYYFNYQRQTIVRTTAENVQSFLYITQQRSIGQEESSQWGVHFDNPAGGGKPFYASFKGAAYSTPVETRFLDAALDFAYPAEGTSFDIVFSRINGKVADGAHKKVYVSLNPGTTVKAVNVSPFGVITMNDGEVGWWKMDEGSGTTTGDSSGYGRTATLNGATWTVSGQSGNALSFDGSNDYVTSGYVLSGTNSYTITGWIYVSSAFPSGKYDRFLGTPNWGVGRAGIMITPGYSLQVNSYFGSGYDYWLGSGVTVPRDVWFHVAAVFDRGGEERIYYNGVRKGTANMSAAQAVSWNGDQLRLACSDGGVYAPHNGKIDDVKIYDRALSDDEVKHLYEITK